MTKKHVAVIMGGWSPERDISLISGEGCAKALEASNYQVSRIDAGRNLAEQLQAVKPDVIFNALHGQFGEDGYIQSVIERYRIPYTHSGVIASSIAMDKELSKKILIYSIASVIIYISSGSTANSINIFAQTASINIPNRNLSCSAFNL